MAIATTRRELMRHAKATLLFFDETYVRIGFCRTHTLVAPGEQPYVVVDDTDKYAPRYDMIACCSGERVFPPIIFSPEDRRGMDVREFANGCCSSTSTMCWPKLLVPWTSFPSLWLWTVQTFTTRVTSSKRFMIADAKTCRQCT